MKIYLRQYRSTNKKAHAGALFYHIKGRQDSRMSCIKSTPHGMAVLDIDMQRRHGRRYAVLPFQCKVVVIVFCIAGNILHNPKERREIDLFMTGLLLCLENHETGFGR